MDQIDKIFLSIIPLFVAIDVIGVVPIFLSLTEGKTIQAKKTLVTQATLTAVVISLIFIAVGDALFTFLGITENDFRIGGGIVLLILAITDLLFSEGETSRNPQKEVGIVPIGIPLIMGPAALTTILMTLDSHGYVLTIFSLLVNLGVVWIVFRNAHWIAKILGKGGSKAFAKVASLFLTAIAVMMIRVGISNLFHLNLQ